LLFRVGYRTPHSEFRKGPGEETIVTEITLSMIRETLSSAVIADALDGLGFRQQSPRVQLSPLTGATTLAGRCKTTLWADVYHEDSDPYALELRAVDSCQPEDVVICAAHGSMRSALWGELLSTAAQCRGCKGAIVDGAVRDLAKMQAMGFPVFAAGTSVYDSQNRQQVVAFDEPVDIAGVCFAPGDLVFADRDGVVVVPQSAEEEAVRRAWEKTHAENDVRNAIRDGLSATEAYRKYGVL
jgi:4-hydroxy-4-methyl-2-oxoglutarate aldolase